MGISARASDTKPTLKTAETEWRLPGAVTLPCAFRQIVLGPVCLDIAGPEIDGPARRIECVGIGVPLLGNRRVPPDHLGHDEAVQISRQSVSEDFVVR